MPASALALVLIAALLHAVWNIVAKKAGGNHHFALLSVSITVLLWAPVATWFGVTESARWGQPNGSCCWPALRCTCCISRCC